MAETAVRGKPVACRSFRVTVAVLVGCLVLVAVAGVGAFDDDEGGTHEPGTDALRAEGILEGTECGAGHICPTEPMLRWVMAVWLVRAVDGADPAGATSGRFSDVSSDEWWASHVERLAELEVTLGCGDGTGFCPADVVTRGQMATFLVRAFGLDADGGAGFTDIAGNTHEASINILAAERVTAGCSTSPLRYCPNRSVTRGQMATFLARALDLIPRPQPAEPSKEWTLLAGGDVLMDRTELAGVDPFVFIEPALASADLAVVNSEMAISDRGVRANKRFAFRAPPSAARRIASAGIDVASLGNNHAKDYGSLALVDTVDLLEAAGVVAVGAGATDVEAYRYRVLRTAGDVSVAFVGVSMTVPGGFPAGPDSPGIASAHAASRVIESVWEASGAADVVIAVVHWGIELATCPSGTQRDFARELLDAGADAVIGHGPHVVQPVEFSDGKLVAYSLGHLVWHPRWGITRDTGVLQIDFDADEIVGWAFHPHLLNEDGAPVPVAEGGRYDRIVDIIAGDCGRHQPPPSSTTTTPTTSTTTLGATDTTTSDA